MHSSLNYQRDEEKRIYLFLNYRRNEDKPKYLFLNQRRNKEKIIHSSLNYQRDEQKQIYLFLNYWRNEDEQKYLKYLFLNYWRNEDEPKYSFLNYRWFDIATQKYGPLLKMAMLEEDNWLSKHEGIGLIGPRAISLCRTAGIPPPSRLEAIVYFVSW